MGDLVELPSGNVEPQEALVQALAREVFEETGLQIVSIDRYVDSFDYLSGGQRVRQFNFRTTVQPGQIVLDPREHQKYYLVPPSFGNLNWHNMSVETKQTILNAID